MVSSVDESAILLSLSMDSPDYLGRHLDALRRFAAGNPVEAGLIINALVGGMVQSNAHTFMRGLSSEPPRSLRPDSTGHTSHKASDELSVEGTLERPIERPSERVFERTPERMTGPQEAIAARTSPRSTPPRPSEAPFSAQLIQASEAPAAVHHGATPPMGAPEPPELEVGDQVQHRWLGVGVVERIWWRDDHWHVATDRFGAPASRLKRVVR